MKYFIILLIAMVSLTSCKNSETRKEKTQRERTEALEALKEIKGQPVTIDKQGKVITTRADYNWNGHEINDGVLTIIGSSFTIISEKTSSDIIYHLYLHGKDTGYKALHSTYKYKGAEEGIESVISVLLNTHFKDRNIQPFDF